MSPEQVIQPLQQVIGVHTWTWYQIQTYGIHSIYSFAVHTAGMWPLLNTPPERWMGCLLSINPNPCPWSSPNQAWYFLGWIWQSAYAGISAIFASCILMASHGLATG
eukprot:12850321-Ditylum_brightwellii.AAC.1